MKIALGTVQFGMDYGLSNLNGQTSKKEVFRILQYAKQSKIDLLDTAPSYGDSEKLLGDNLGNHSWRCVIKTPQFLVEKIDTSHVSILNKTFHKSLANLRQTNVHALLLHSCYDLFSPGGELLIKEMQKLKSLGLIQKVGISLYNANQIEIILDKYDIDLIQLPINILDQKLLLEGWLRKIKDRKIEIHARSVFLQGLLLMPVNSIPSYFSPIKHKFEMLQANADDLSVSKLDLLLSFVMSIKEIDQIIVGVNSLSQLKEIINAREIKMNSKDYKNYAVDSPVYVNPSMWKL